MIAAGLTLENIYYLGPQSPLDTSQRAVRAGQGRAVHRHNMGWRVLRRESVGERPRVHEERARAVARHAQVRIDVHGLHAARGRPPVERASVPRQQTPHAVDGVPAVHEEPCDERDARHAGRGDHPGGRRAVAASGSPWRPGRGRLWGDCAEMRGEGVGFAVAARVATGGHEAEAEGGGGEGDVGGGGGESEESVAAARARAWRGRRWRGRRATEGGRGDGVRRRVFCSSIRSVPSESRVSLSAIVRTRPPKVGSSFPQPRSGTTVSPKMVVSKLDSSWSGRRDSGLRGRVAEGSRKGRGMVAEGSRKGRGRVAEGCRRRLAGVKVELLRDAADGGQPPREDLQLVQLEEQLRLFARVGECPAREEAAERRNAGRRVECLVRQAAGSACGRLWRGGRTREAASSMARKKGEERNSSHSLYTSSHSPARAASVKGSDEPDAESSASSELIAAFVSWYAGAISGLSRCPRSVRAASCRTFGLMVAPGEAVTAVARAEEPAAASRIWKGSRTGIAARAVSSASSSCLQ